MLGLQLNHLIYIYIYIYSAFYFYKSDRFHSYIVFISVGVGKGLIELFFEENQYPCSCYYRRKKIGLFMTSMLVIDRILQ